MQRCRDAEMQRCRDAEMQRCRDAEKKALKNKPLIFFASPRLCVKFGFLDFQFIYD
jgi:hypothetical protein